jgi:hypothetical protein
MLVNTQFNPAITPQSYSQDAKRSALRSGTQRTNILPPQQLAASKVLVSGTMAVRAKEPLHRDTFQQNPHSPAASTAPIREGSVAVSGFKTKQPEHYGLIEDMMVRFGEAVNTFLP